MSARDRTRVPGRLGTTTVQLDHDLWQWGVTDAPAVWKMELVQYDQE
jgi:hypothetical protein